MNRLHYRYTYYQWLGTYTSLTYETAKRAARAYLPTDFSYLPSEKDKAENVLFWPLVESGVVRYLGADRYAYSPTLAYRLANGKYLFANVNHDPLDKMPQEDLSTAEKEMPGLKISDIPPVNKKVHILRDFSLTDYLPLIPPLQNIISLWPLTTQKFNQVRYHGRWQVSTKENNKDPVQLYRTTEDYGGKQAVRIDHNLYRIPGRTENPEAYPLSILYADLNTTSDYQPIQIAPATYSVTINSKIFPVELRKLLFLEHVVTQATFPTPGGPYSFRPDALPFLSKCFTS
jgi:hypothetical protein